MESNHDVKTVLKINEAQQRLRDASHRLLKVMSRLEVIRNRGTSCTPDEERLRARLELLLREIDQPVQIRARLNELRSQLLLLRDSRTVRPGQSQRFEIIDQDALQQIFRVLAEQQDGLEHLTELLQSDVKDLDLINRTIGPQ